MSSATYVAQSLRQALAGFDCAICMQLFVEPRVLPCGHSFCTSCIAMLLVGPAPHKCAMCKRNLVVPENDVNKLPKNYALISAASSSSSNSVSNVTDEANYIVRCSEHAQETAQLYCQDCSVRVCNKCIEARTHLRHALISAQQHYAEQVASIVALRDRAKRGAQLLEQYSRERNSILQESRADAERIRSHVHELIHSGIAALTHLQSRIDSEIQGVAYDVELHLESVNRKFGERAAEMMATLSLSRSEHDLTGWLEHAERLQSRVEELERCVAGPLTHPPGIQLEAHFEQQIVSFRQTADSLRELLFRKRQCIIYRQGERDGVMFMIGGSDKRGVSGQVRLFNPYKRVWVTISAELHEARECAASAVLRSTVYVCGGRSASTCLASCEAFDPQVGLWSPIASLCAPRYAHAVLSLGEALYAVGGQHEQQTLSSVEKYEPETDKWTDVRPMSAARGHVAAAAFKVSSISALCQSCVINVRFCPGTSCCDRRTRPERPGNDLRGVRPAERRLATDCCAEFQPLRRCSRRVERAPVRLRRPRSQRLVRGLPGGVQRSGGQVVGFRGDARVPTARWLRRRGDAGVHCNRRRPEGRCENASLRLVVPAEFAALCTRFGPRTQVQQRGCGFLPGRFRTSHAAYSASDRSA